MPVVVTLAPRLEVDDTAKVVKPVAAPSKSKIPVMVRALLPPTKVDAKLTVEPCKVRSPPDKVTSSL